MTTEIAKIVIMPLTTAVGSAVRGVDLATLSDPDFEKIRSALFNRCMLVFPDQALEDASLLKFAGRWGEIMVMPMPHLCRRLSGYPAGLQSGRRQYADGILARGFTLSGAAARAFNPHR